MSDAAVELTVRRGRTESRIGGTRVVFSPHRYFGHADASEVAASLRRLGHYLLTLPRLALFGEGWLREQLLMQVPALRSGVAFVRAPDELAADVETVFLCETAVVERARMRARLPSRINVIDASVLAEISPDTISARGWVPAPRSIYPVELPQVRFEPDLDLVLLDCPARNLALMPNGLAYVHNALKKTAVRHQVFDLDLVAYHRFHMHRLFDRAGRVTLPGGRVLPEDPWQAQHYDLWAARRGGDAGVDPANELITFFGPLIDETVAALIEARPRILGLSLQQCNEAISGEIARRLLARCPEVVILVGGFSCYQADIGLRAFPDCHYMCIGEADLTVGPLVEALARGERPVDQPGILSRFDSPGRRFIPAPMPHDLDRIDFPRYEWCDLSLYRNWNGYQLTPIIASRGCRWSRCTFCAERFYWRMRSAENFVDELEWLVAQGCHLFMFNESDLNGMPERLVAICDEIIRRGLQRKVKLTGQLRIHKKSDRAFFAKLREANFVALRFGVDAFSANTLRLQKKGYTKEMVAQNLRDCWESGIFTEVNWVIGVPGETEADVDEGIDFILQNRQHIGRLANINPLILVNGGVYWIDPDAHGIRFREPREELLAQHPRALPADAWYSTDPHIDAHVRKRYFERIVLCLHEAGFPVGEWANRVIEDVRLARDPNRAARAGRRSEPFGGQGTTPPTRPARAAGETADRWADSRGEYDSREGQRAQGSYLRAGSVIEDTGPDAIAEDSKIVHFQGEYFAVEASSLREANAPGAAHAVAGFRQSAEIAPAELKGGTLRQKAAALLPASWLETLRRLVRWQLLASDHGSVPAATLTNRQLAAVLLKAVVGAYLLRPMRRLSEGSHAAHEAPVSGTSLRIVGATSRNALPELLRSAGRYNLIAFDGSVYAVPRGRFVDWSRIDFETEPSVVRGRSISDVIAKIPMDVERGRPYDVLRRQGPVAPGAERGGAPRALAPIGTHRLYFYEGWYYAIPGALGPIDLAAVDVMELPGVIRDVSRETIEAEIRDRAAGGRVAA